LDLLLQEDLDGGESRPADLRREGDLQALGGRNALELLHDRPPGCAGGLDDVEVLEHLLALKGHTEDALGGLEVLQLGEVQPDGVRSGRRRGGLFDHLQEPLSKERALRVELGLRLGALVAALAFEARKGVERHRQTLRAASGALANEIRVYQGVRDTADDVIRGAIFLLLALVPFSFAMERLLLSTPRIYRQIAAMFCIFTVMTAVLWSFHPAFRISSQPLMIVMAFAIIFMSLLVLGVVYAKFESGLEEMRSGRAESSGAQTSRMGVLVTAVRLGIANMRKRKLRTALTGAAVVLITFSLLCFMSTSTYTGRRQLTVDVEARYTGVLIRQPSRRPMSEDARSLLENLLGDLVVLPLMD